MGGSSSDKGRDKITSHSRWLPGAGKDMPKAIRDRIVRDVNAVLSAPGVRKKLKAAGQEVIGGGPELLGDLVAKQRTRVIEISKFIDLKSAK